MRVGSLCERTKLRRRPPRKRLGGRYLEKELGKRNSCNDVVIPVLQSVIFFCYFLFCEVAVNYV
jgi:hypothetical protein